MGDKSLVTMTSFEDICKYIERKDCLPLNKLLQNIIPFGLLILPMAFSAYSSYDIINHFATGASLAGAGVHLILQHAANALFPQKSRRGGCTYEDMEAICAMSCIVSFFEAIEDTIRIQDETSVWNAFLEKYKENPNIPCSKDAIFKEFDITVFSSSQLLKIYKTLTDEFKRQFDEKIVNNNPKIPIETRSEYYKCISELPENALRKYREFMYELTCEHNELQYWLSQRFYEEMIDSYRPESKIDSYLKEHELAHIHRKEFFYLFDNMNCEVERVFTLNNYYLMHYSWDTPVAEQTEKRKVKSTDEIIDIISKQRYLLVSGSYGTGKTMLMKKLYLEYKRNSKNVYAFSATTFYDLLIKRNYHEFYSFLDVFCEDKDECIVMVDAVDDINVPRESGSDISVMDTFIDAMYTYLQKNQNVSFVINSRPLVYESDESVSVAQKISLVFGEEGEYITTTEFSTDDVTMWLDRYPFTYEKITNKHTVKSENSKIVSALQNPLFLYVFVTKYEEDGKISNDEGFYYYYDLFIQKTIKGKYNQESIMGSSHGALADFSDKYRDLLQKIAFDILKANSVEISKIISPLELSEEQPLLDLKLHDRKLSITTDKFSQNTQEVLNSFSKEITQANALNCYFLKKVGNTIFFTDANILFSLASNRIYDQLIQLAEEKVFDISHLDKMDVIDFYPQILDYLLYRLRNKSAARKVNQYVRSFVTNNNIQSHLNILCNNLTDGKETYAQILMLYVLFFKLNKGSLSGEYSNIFDEMLSFRDIYQIFLLSVLKETQIYSVERYFMSTTLSDLKSFLQDLSFFNFKGSTFSNAEFHNCVFENTNFENIRVNNSMLFDTCSFRQGKQNNLTVQDMNYPDGTDVNIQFKDCKIASIGIKAKTARFFRCNIQKLTIDCMVLDKICFEQCIIEKLEVAHGNEKSRALLQFDGCVFVEAFDLSGYTGDVKVNSSCLLRTQNGTVFGACKPSKIIGKEKVIREKHQQD